MKKLQIIITGIKEPTEKGFQTIQCSVTRGFASNSKPSYVLSTPAAIEAHKLKIGLDISDMCEGMVHTSSKAIDTATGEEMEFNWITVDANKG